MGMTRAERRRRTWVKLAKRKKMVKDHGFRGGTLYERHQEKISKSPGYMRDGNVSHYARVGFTIKTRNNNWYRPEIVYSHAEQKRYERQMNDLEEYKRRGF